jgi:hypothetical protein
MTEADLDSIEQALGFALPGFYRRYMVNYPRWLLDKQPDGFDPVTEWEFADEPERVIEFNQFVREQEEGWFFDDRTWPDELLVIGSEDDQNYFAVDRFKEDEGVLFWSHEDGSLRSITESLAGYTEWLVQWWEDARRDSEA